MKIALKRAPAWIAALLLALVLTACGGKTDAGSVETTQVPAAATASPEPTPAPTAKPTPAPTAEPTPAPTVVDFRFTEPEGFLQNPDNPLQLVTKKYPSDSSFIAIGVTPMDESVLSYTSESYGAYLTAYYTEALGKPAQVTIDSFMQKKIDGSAGFRATYFLETSDYWAYLLDVTVVADRNYQVLFSDSTQDNRWTKAFKLSARTIDVVWSDEVDGPDYSVYQLCDNGTGLTIRLGNDMTYGKLDGVTIFYSGENCMMTGLKESYETLTAAGFDPASMTKEEYAAIVEQTNGLSAPFAPDSYGNLAATYLNTVEGNSFLYYSTVRKGTDAFWLVSLACLEAQQDEYLPLFELWANSIDVE